MYMSSLSFVCLPISEKISFIASSIKGADKRVERSNTTASPKLKQSKQPISREDCLRPIFRGSVFLTPTSLDISPRSIIISLVKKMRNKILASDRQVRGSASGSDKGKNISDASVIATMNVGNEKIR